MSQPEVEGSCSGQLLPDRKARKKDQNRRAALNYRRKKMEQRNLMREEEMSLVYSRVYLIGYADQLESNIILLIHNGANRIFDQQGTVQALLCPLCQQACDNAITLRSHLISEHQNLLDILATT